MVVLAKRDGMLLQTCSSQAGGDTAQTPTDPAGSFYLLWLHQWNNFSPSLSLLHLPLHRSQQSAYCPWLLKFHPEITHREQSVPVVGTRPWFFLFVIFFSLFLSWSIKICSTFCHPLFASAVTAWSRSAVFFPPSIFPPLHLYHLHFRLALPQCNQSTFHTHKGICLSFLRATTGTAS